MGNVRAVRKWAEHNHLKCFKRLDLAAYDAGREGLESARAQRRPTGGIIVLIREDCAKRYEWTNTVVIERVAQILSGVPHSPARIGQPEGLTALDIVNNYLDVYNHNTRNNQRDTVATALPAGESAARCSPEI